MDNRESMWDSNPCESTILGQRQQWTDRLVSGFLPLPLPKLRSIGHIARLGPVVL